MPITKLTPENNYPYLDDRLKALEQAVPEAFADGKINWDTLREALGEDLEEGGCEEYFGLNWPGKREARKRAAIPSRGTLVPAPGEGVNEDETENLFIEGDNLEVLKLLQKSYAGKIKMIYIDPPYNTGNDFIYNDDFTDPLEAYLEYTGAKGESGELLTTNTRVDGRFHSKWLSMMYPRLILAKQLLKDDGVIFVSIDDNEVHHLRQLLNEIFGEENFINNIAIKMSESSGMKMAHSDKRLPKIKEYIVFYKKGGKQTLLTPVTIRKEEWDNEYNLFLENFTKQDKERIDQITEKDNIEFTDIDEIDQILEKVTVLSVNNKIKQLGISESEELEWKLDNSYRISRTAASVNVKKLADEKRDKNKNLFFCVLSSRDEIPYICKADYPIDSKKPRVQLLFAEDNLEVNVCDFWPDIRTTGLEFEGGIDFKNGKKPIKLLKRLMKLSTEDEDLVLDFFAGSSSLAHATLDLNRDENTNRRFIMVQLPEKIASGEFLNVAELGKQRIRNVLIELQEKSNKNTQLSLLSKKNFVFDQGFRVFQYTQSNHKQWIYTEEDNIKEVVTLFDDLSDPLIEGWKKEDLISEILLLEGFPLTSKLTYLDEIPKNEVYRVSAPGFCEHELFVCLDEAMQPGTIDALQLEKDDILICLDNALTDELKARLQDRFNVHVI